MKNWHISLSVEQSNAMRSMLHIPKCSVRGTAHQSTPRSSVTHWPCTCVEYECQFTMHKLWLQDEIWCKDINLMCHFFVICIKSLQQSKLLHGMCCSNDNYRKNCQHWKSFTSQGWRLKLNTPVRVKMAFLTYVDWICNTKTRSDLPEYTKHVCSVYIHAWERNLLAFTAKQS